MHSYVIPAEDLILLNVLCFDEIRPIGLEWINRGTDQRLNAISVGTLMRTLYRQVDFSESVQRLQRSTGLRVTFRTSTDCARFKTMFERARTMSARSGDGGTQRPPC
jgi:hypothetical protein